MTEQEQEAYEFTLVIDRPITDDEMDALFEAGCDDAAPEVGQAHTELHFARRAGALVEAIVSAVLNVEKAGLSVAGVGSSDLVDVPAIAARVGRTRESVRLLATGRRGPGDFPSAQAGLFSWVLVKAWFALYDPGAVGSPTTAELDYDRTIAAADHVVRARWLLCGHVGGFDALLPA